jgi:hypothetical protein
MSQTTPALENLARKLVAYETSGGGSAVANAQAGFYVTETLRPHLANAVSPHIDAAEFLDGTVIVLTAESRLSLG